METPRYTATSVTTIVDGIDITLELLTSARSHTLALCKIKDRFALMKHKEATAAHADADAAHADLSKAEAHLVAYLKQKENENEICHG